ncbi:MAG: ADP-ribose pyrophosphatase [Halonotius sp. J07HN6]|nr:MAG: ADP-ribose pyrophosphatase [Halonotius sp. J07HN6]
MTEQPLIAEVSQKAIIRSPDGSLLVMQADDTTWELPGGRMGAYEEPLVGLKREIREETGLDVAVDEPVHTAAWRNDQGRGRYSVVYRCDADLDGRLPERRTLRLRVGLARNRPRRVPHREHPPDGDRPPAGCPRHRAAASRR